MFTTKLEAVVEIGDLYPISIVAFLGGLELQYYLAEMGLPKIHLPKQYVGVCPVSLGRIVQQILNCYCPNAAGCLDNIELRLDSKQVAVQVLLHQ